MKRILMSTAIVAALSTGAYAETAQTNTQTQATAEGQAQAPVTASGNIFAKVTTAESVKGDVRASTLIGKDIYIPKPATKTSAQASAGASADASASSSAPAASSDPMANLEDIGSVGDVILSKDGKVDAVLVDVGGFLGIGTHTVALDWTALHWQMKQDAKSAADSYLVIQATKQQLEKAPAFKEDWLKGATAASYQSKSVGAQASDMAQGAADSVKSATQTVGQNMADATSSAKQKIAEMGDSSDHTQAQAGNATGAQPTAAASATVGGSATGPVAKAQADGFTQTNLAALTKKELVGARVYDMKGDEAGEVSKVIMGASSNKIEGAVVKVGGFLGIGEKAIEVKADTMTVMTKNNGQDVRIYVNLTQQQLKQLPAYKQG